MNITKKRNQKTLKELDMPPKKVAAFEKKGIFTTEDLVRLIPRKYYDFREETELLPFYHDKYVAVVGTLLSLTTQDKSGKIMVTAKIKTEHKILSVYMFGMYHIYKIAKEWGEIPVIVCGKLSYNQQFDSYAMGSPLVFSKNIDQEKRIKVIYPKFSGISEEYLQDQIEKNLDCAYYDPVPDSILNHFRLMTQFEAIQSLHKPGTIEGLNNARKRMVFDDLLYFAVKLNRNDRVVSKGSQYNLRSIKMMLQVKRNLPFELSSDQQSTVHEILENMKQGVRVNCLIQGDVGCGKTIVSLLLMIAMADSGFQSVLMAPTVVLAKQHYQDMCKLVEPFGLKVAFLGGKQKVSEKKVIYKGIKDGSISFVIGTHSVIGKDVEYNNLALAITDEEHKFGVLQRDALTEKAKAGTHTITMSATPIPRTLAQTLYGNSVDVYSINSMPKGRIPIQTAISSNQAVIFKFLLEQIKQGRQAYVICPLIEKDEDNKTMSKVMSVEETVALYEAYFSQHSISIGCVTGKTPLQEAEKIIQEFKELKTQVLVSTTVIEVGVNVPNASTIVINNAERYGLAGLHQLRGRVGRGSYKSYCILKSDITPIPERLNVLTQTTNGFEIAEADLQLRGTGDIVGTDQSGDNRYIKTMLKYPNMYERVKEIAEDMVDCGDDEAFIDAMDYINFHVPLDKIQIM